MATGSGQCANSKPTNDDRSDRLVDENILRVVAKGIGKKWMELGRALGVQNSQLDAIHVEYVAYGLKEMVSQTLRAWQEDTSTISTVAYLARKLQEIGKQNLSEHILTIPPNPIDVDTNQQERNSTSRIEWLNSLKTVLRNRHRRLVMKGLPWMDDVILSLSDYYVDISVVTQGSKEEKKSRDINEALKPVFATKEHPLRVLVEGAPGYGKSTLSGKLCFDHTNKEDYIADFDLVLQYPLRHYEGCLEEIFFEAACLTDSHDKQNLLEVLNNKSNRILLILDGFDEVPKKHVKSIFSFIQGEQFPRVSVVVTTRPGQFTFERWETESKICELTINWNKIWQSRIEILGMNIDTREVFITKHLADFPENFRNEVLVRVRQMEADDIIASEFLECPLFLLMIILLLINDDNKDTHKLRTKTELYVSVFNFILRRYCSKQKEPITKNVDLFNVNKSSRPFYVDLLSQFGEFALWALMEGKLSFSRGEILGRNHQRDPKILDIGLLTQSVFKMGFKETVVYEPVHKSLLEFAAAYTIWLLFPHTIRDKWIKKVLQLMRYEHKSGSSCLPMLIGLMKHQVGALLDALKPFARYCVWEWWLKRSLYEIQLTEPVLHSLTPFLPNVWRSSKQKGDGSSSQNIAVLYHGIREGKIKYIELGTLNNTIPEEVVVENAMLVDIDEPTLNAHTFRCKHLIVTDSLFGSNFETFLHIFSRFFFQSLSFEFYDDSSDILHKFSSLITAGIWKDTHIRFIDYLVYYNPEKPIELLTELIKEERLNTIRLTIDGDVLPTELMNSLIECAAVSCHLTNLTLSNHTGKSLTIDLAQFCDGGKKTWECLSLEGFNIEFSGQIGQIFRSKYLCLGCNVLEPFRVYNVCQMTSLVCATSLLTHIGNLRLLHGHLTELNISVDDLFMNTKQCSLDCLRNLRIIMITLTPFEYKPLSCPPIDFLFGSNSFLRLKGIELWKVSKNPKLALELTKWISQCLEECISIPSTHQGTEPLDSQSPSHLLPPPKRLQLEYFLLRSQHLCEIDSILPEMKTNLINKSISRLDLGFAFGNSIDLIDIFSPEDGFRLERDLWGSKTEDTIQGRLEYEFWRAEGTCTYSWTIQTHHCYSVSMY